VDSFKVIRGLGYGLDESAINTIATKWRFRPGTLNGVPVTFRPTSRSRFVCTDPDREYSLHRERRSGRESGNHGDESRQKGIQFRN